MKKNDHPQTSKFAKHSKKSAHPIVLLFILYHLSLHTLLPTNLYPIVVGTIAYHKIQPMFLHLSITLIFKFFITFILSICLNNFNSQIFLSRRRLFYFSFFPKISFVFFCFFSFFSYLCALYDIRSKLSLFYINNLNTDIL